MIPPVLPRRSRVLDSTARLLTEDFEGFSATPYQDSVGVWTIGFGTTRDALGHPVTTHTPAVTRDQAHVFMVRDLGSALTSVDNAVKVPMTENEEAALTDFVYNLGAGNFTASTLLRKLNAKDYHGAAAEFTKWNLAGGKVLAGLVRRRASETALFNKA